jgi:Tfp pilus assembly protein FimT
MVELVVVIGLIAMIASVGISAYVKAQKQQRLSGMADKVHSMLEMAKDMAITNNTPYQLKVDPPVLNTSQSPIKLSVAVLGALNNQAELLLDDNSIVFNIQTTGTWTPIPTPPPCPTASWTADYAYKQGNMVSNNGYTYICNNAGVSGSSPPNWVPSPLIGSIVTDTVITWTCISPLIFYQDGTTNSTVSLQFYFNDGTQALSNVGGFNPKRIDVYQGGMIKVFYYNTSSGTWY